MVRGGGGVGAGLQSGVMGGRREAEQEEEEPRGAAVSPTVDVAGRKRASSLACRRR